MKKHGWQLPYHPLQVVAVAVFLALGFAFYVFFAPFVGNNLLQYIAIGLYTPLITCAFSLYIWCAAADPADPGVFKSKKYLKIPDSKNHVRFKESKLGGESTSSIQDANAATIGGKPLDKGVKDTDTAGEDYTAEIENKNASPCHSFCFTALMAFIPCASLCICSNQHEESCEQQLSEDGMFYCSLCEVEVFKYSKHCRVCDKCVDRFDHHCRWLNNCIGKGTTGSFSPSWSLPFSWLPFTMWVLQGAVKMVWSLPGVMRVACTFMLVMLLWLALWSFGAAGVVASSIGALRPRSAVIYMQVFSVSLFWMSAVLCNTVHVIVSGMVFLVLLHGGREAASMPSKPLMKYLRYAMTTFGSICYGSLFTAAIWTLRWKIRGFRSKIGNNVESSVSAPTDGQNTRGLTMAQAPSNMVGHLSHFHTNYEEDH